MIWLPFLLIGAFPLSDCLLFLLNSSTCDTSCTHHNLTCDKNEVLLISTDIQECAYAVLQVLPQSILLFNGDTYDSIRSGGCRAFIQSNSVTLSMDPIPDGCHVNTTLPENWYSLCPCSNETSHSVYPSTLPSAVPSLSPVLISRTPTTTLPSSSSPISTSSPKANNSQRLQSKSPTIKIPNNQVIPSLNIFSFVEILPVVECSDSPACLS